MNDDDDGNIPIRNPKGQFVKGVSGNPAGGSTPKWVRAMSGQKYLIEDILRQETPFVLQRLMVLINDAKTPATARVSAIKLWLEHAIGKPRQTVVTHQSSDDTDLIDLSHLSIETLEAVAALIPFKSPKDE